ncbi:hypothetical protein IAT40_003506 [Kwoniella sp. CBS 6097]
MHSSHSGQLAPRLEMWARDSCIQCDTATPQCNCSAGEKCILTSRTCNQCPSIQCIKSASSKSKSLNPGAIAGPIVALLVIASFGLFWWLRRKKRRDLARLEALADRARKAEAAGFQLSQPGSPPGSARSHSLNSRSSLPAPPPSAARARSPLPPAPVNAEYYDENGATIRVYNASRGTIDLDKSGDPFSDRQSISTMGSGGTANIIPIQYIPPSKSDEALSKKSGGPGPANQSAAAKRLDEARQNLLHPRRPARAPDLDLRLTVPGQSGPGAGGSSSAPPSAYDLRSPGGSSSQYRDSYLSGNSAAPSYWSGQSDVHLDAPKIVTSKQVQIGRLQQAEVVQFGKPQMIERLGGQSSTLPGGRLSPVHDVKENPFNGNGNGNRDDLEPPSALSPTGSFQSGEATIRTLTPMSNRRFDEEEEEGLRSAEPSSAGTGDLRFSMGSLAYRDSVSTMGTGNFMASASNNPSYTHLPPPLPGSRMSNGSSRSFADSVLGAFPMIPPHAESGNGRTSQFPHGIVSRSESVTAGLPQSTSVSTLDHAALSSRPPPLHSLGSNAARGYHDENAYTEHLTDSPSVYTEANTPRKRPETQASVADSFLGSFPFLHPGAGGTGAGTNPNPEDMASMPSGVNSQRGVSTTSEGLGGFDFRLGDAPPVPVPATRSRSDTRDQK